jgi:ribosome maturation factor RimP
VVSIPFVERNMAAYFECDFVARENKHFLLEISSPGLMGLEKLFAFVR